MGLFNFIKSSGQRKTESDTRKKKAKVRELQSESSAMRGGAKAGLSRVAAGSLARNMTKGKNRPRATETWHK